MPELAEVLAARRRSNPELCDLKRLMARRALEQEMHRLVTWPTQSQAAQFLGVHRGTINRAIKNEKISSETIYGKTRVDPASLFWRMYATQQRELDAYDRRY